MQCTHDITPTISYIASTLSVSSQPLYLWSLANCMYDVPPTLYVTSYAPHITSHPLFMTSHHWSQHITSTEFMTSHSLKRLHKHDITNVTSAISPTISDITSTLSVSSNPEYRLYDTHSLDDITHYLCDIILNMHGLRWTLYDITLLYDDITTII